MAKASKHRLFQSGLLVLWIALVVTEVTVSVESQACIPPMVTPGYMNPITITFNSWRPAIGNVIVKIDSEFNFRFANDAADRIEEGHRKWNNLITCAGVNFVDFEIVNFSAEDYDNDAPFGHVYWQVDYPGTSDNGLTFSNIGFGGRVESAVIKIRPDLAWSNSSNPIYFNYLGSHEIGHTFNLKDCLSFTSPACLTGGLTIMGGHTNTAFDAQGPTACDLNAAKQIYCPSTPSPTPTPTPDPDWPWPDPFPPTDPETCQNGGWYWNFTNDTCNRDPADATCGSTKCVPYVIPTDGGDCAGADDYCAMPYGCPPGTVDGGRGCCCFPTPVLIDLSGNGFSLTDAYNGVMFDMGGDGKKEPVAWTTTDNDDAWLVLDRNGNGQIDSAKEMFGNFTDQPHATTRLNGFVALAEFDRNDNGGNGDEKITSADSVFANLRLWQDRNRNGVSEPGELHTLTAFNIATLDLDYKESKKSDTNGNRFSYRAKVKDAQGNQIGRWAWDVTLSANPPPRR